MGDILLLQKVMGKWITVRTVRTTETLFEVELVSQELVKINST